MNWLGAVEVYCYSKKTWPNVSPAFGLVRHNGVRYIYNQT